MADPAGVTREQLLDLLGNSLPALVASPAAATVG
jgi:hypothetical protein